MRDRAPVLLLAAVALVFWPALLGDYVYDDTALVLLNQGLRGSDIWALVTELPFGPEFGYWRPVTALALWLGHVVGGAFGIHLLALLLHGAAGLVAFDLAKRYLESRATATAVALLFLLHPVQVESVAWCSAINDPLWCLFALFAVRSVLRWRDRGAGSMPIGTGVLLLLALLTKENAVAAIPIVWAAAIWAPAQTAARPGKLAIVTAISVVAWWLLRTLAFGELGAGFLRAPAEPPIDTLRLWTGPIDVFLRHIALLPLPWCLSPFRGLAETVGAAKATLLVVSALAAIAGMWLAWRRPAMRLSIVLVAAPLLPTVIGYRAVGSYPIADRYLYLSAFGFALLLATLLPKKLVPLLWLLAAASGALSFVQTWVWQDQTSLVQHGRACSPTDPTLMVMTGDLALARAQTGDSKALQFARDEYAKAEAAALALSSDLPHRALADARLGLAWCMFLTQSGQAARNREVLITAFRRAVDTDPKKAAAWVGLGVAYGTSGQSYDAERSFQTALRLDPNHSEAACNLGFLHIQNGAPGKARSSLKNALRSNPDNERARQLLDSLR